VKQSRILAAIAGAIAVGCAVSPSSVGAVTTGTGTDTLTVTAGTLSVASVGTASFAVTLGSGNVTTAATNLNAGTYADSTGSGAGWNGTLALQQFVNTQNWVATGTALTSTAPGVYNAVLANVFYTVAVTADGGTTVGVSWSGTEAGSGTATKGTAFAIGTHGITILFQSGTTFLTSDRYNMKADVLATNALVMAAGGTCVNQGTTTAGTNLPTMTNTSATVTGGTYNTFGTAVKVITAAVNAGLGTFICTPKATITVDSNGTWASAYTATAQYSIVTGP
jgi:hypothetical protein